MMWRIARPAAVAATVALVIAGLAAPGVAGPPQSDGTLQAALSGPGHDVHFGPNGEADVNVCSDTVAPGFAHCDAHVRTDRLSEGAHPEQHGVSSSGTLGNSGAYDPAYLQSAYNAPSATNGAGQTVAIVDAFDAPNVESDLGTYRSEFGLPACTTANGCFTKVDESGGTNYPAANASWGQEISLDVDMVSAICPLCHILLVEASDSSIFNLGTAVNEAVALGANVVSNSYGGGEWSGEPQADVAFFDHPGVAIVASTGDGGFGVNYPAASPDVVAVGGTSLFQATNTGTRDATETVWSGAGSGCSSFEAKPAWQTDTGCTHRTVGDVSAVADPNTGVWVYDGGWLVFGGTSVSSPIVGSLFALAGNAASSDQVAAYPYAHPSDFNDVVSGSNGNCGGTYLCTGVVGYDGPTGLGTPGSVDAFTPGPSGPALPPPDFSLTASAVPAMRPGAAVKSTLVVTPQNGFGGSVQLSATVSPNMGISKSFSATAVTVGALPGTATLSLMGNKAGVYTVTITAKQGSLTHTRVITADVNDFSIHVAPAKVTVVRGKPAHFTVTLAPLGAFKSPITLAVTGLRAHDKAAYSHNPAPASGMQTITITTSPLDAKGTVTLTFRGAGGSIGHSVTATLVLQ